MMRRDPALIIRLRSRSDSRPIRANNRDLISGIDLLRLAGRPLGPLTAFASAPGLGEECADPGAVDEIDSAKEAGQEDEVEEYAVRIQGQLRF